MAHHNRRNTYYNDRSFSQRTNNASSVSRESLDNKHLNESTYDRPHRKNGGSYDKQYRKNESSYDKSPRNNENSDGRSFSNNENSKNSGTQDRLEFYVDSSKLGLIIGKKGSRINELREQTHTKIFVREEDKNEYGETLIVVCGDTMSDCNEAKSLILEIASKDVGTFTRGNRSPQRERSMGKRSWDNNSGSVEEEEHNAKTKNWKDIYDDYLKKEKEKWSQSAKIIKDFYVEDPAVASLSREEVKEFRLQNQNITVESLAGQTEKDDRDPDPGLTVRPEEDTPPNPVRNFAEAFDHFPEIMEEIRRAKFVKPSPIQMQAWPIILKGRDLIGIAQTGTGKTLAFLLPALIHIEGQPTPRKERPGPTVLVITPTRELALQIEEEVNKYKYRGIKCVCIYGGGSRRDQINTVSEGVEIVVATPGRLNDLIASNHLCVDNVSYVVLDEADRMLDLGFQPDIYKALYRVRPGRQTIMTTATWPSEVRRLAHKYMKDPFQVCIGSMDLTAVHSVEQRVWLMDNAEKFDKLQSFLRNELTDDQKVIIFMTRKATVDHVSSSLAVFSDCYCASITGDREQCDREAAIEDIKSGQVRALIATDVASRGIDIKDITHVINYDFPKNIEEYVHRIGRTGRAGRTGIAITFFTRDDWRHASELIRIMEEANQEVPEDLHAMAKRYDEMKTRKAEHGGREGGGGRREGGGGRRGGGGRPMF